jgi:hypothetical protein
MNFLVNYFIAFFACWFCVSRISHKSVGDGWDLVPDISASWAVITMAFGSLYKNWSSQPICRQWIQNLLLSHDKGELQVRSSNGIVKLQNTFYCFITTTDEMNSSI